MDENSPLAALTDPGKVQRLLAALQKAAHPMMVREIAAHMGVSPNTAGKYVDICEAKGLVSTSWYATARQVSLKAKGAELLEKRVV